MLKLTFYLLRKYNINLICIYKNCELIVYKNNDAYSIFIRILQMSIWIWHIETIIVFISLMSMPFMWCHCDCQWINMNKISRNFMINLHNFINFFYKTHYFLQLNFALMHCTMLIVYRSSLSELLNNTCFVCGARSSRFYINIVRIIFYQNLFIIIVTPNLK